MSEQQRSSKIKQFTVIDLLSKRKRKEGEKEKEKKLAELYRISA